MKRSRLLLPIVLVILVACRAQPTPTPPPPIPTPVPRTPVPLSPRAITPENAEHLQLLGCREGEGWTLAFSPDARLLVATCEGQVCLCDSHTLTVVHRLGTRDSYYGAAFSPDLTLVAASTDSGKVWLWRVSDGSVERILQAPDRRLWAVAFSADGTTVVASDLSPDVFVWRVADGALLRSFEGHVPRDYYPPQPIAAALSPDGALLALKERGEVRLWRTDDGSLLRVLSVRGRDTGSLDFASDGRFLVAGSGPEMVLWELQQSELALARTIAWADSACCLALSPDGSLLATGSIFKSDLLLRRVEDGATLRSLKTQHSEGPKGLLFSPDGSLLATWGGGVTCLWGLAP